MTEEMIMSDLSLAIVIPVYNTNEVLLRKCMDSILCQTDPRWNLWIIDDGSRKETADCCDSFLSDTDKRIHVIHRKNAGVSAARNYGVQCSEDPYILFVDSDDVVSRYMVEDALSVIEKENADVVLGGVCKIHQQDDFERFDSQAHSGRTMKERSKEDILKRLCGDRIIGLSDIGGVGYVGRGPWAKVIQRDIALNTLFPEGLPIGEDAVWSMRVIGKAKKCVVLDRIWYGYVIYPSSAISKYYGNRESLICQWLAIAKEENSLFFRNNPRAEGILLMKELYSVIRFDVISPKNEMSLKQKNRYIDELLRKYPWNQLNDKSFREGLGTAQKCLLLLCKWKMGATVSDIYCRFKRKGRG